MQETAEEATRRRTTWARQLAATTKWDAGVHPEHGVVIYWHERIWQVVGGDIVAPSMRGLVGVRVGEVQWITPRERQEPRT
jgi:hypothetical protein